MGLFGPPNVEKLKAKKDIGGLIKALSYQKDYQIRACAAEALGKIGDDRAIEPLIAALRDSDIRKVAAEALGKIGVPVVEPLIAALRDEETSVPQAAVEPLIAA